MKRAPEMPVPTRPDTGAPDVGASEIKTPGLGIHNPVLRWIGYATIGFGVFITVVLAFYMFILMLDTFF